MSGNLSVIHVSSPLSWRGGEQQLFYLHTTLRSQGIDSIVYCPVGSVLSDRLPKNQQVNYKKRSGVDFAAARKLARLCKERFPGIIHAHDSHSHTTSVLAASLYGNRCPVVLSRRVDFKIGSSFFSRFKYNHKSIKAILCVSNAIRAIVKSGISAPHIQLETVHSGVSLDKFSGVTQKDIREEIGVSKKTRIVANVAALADHKDYFTFLNTAKILNQTQTDIAFVILGSGELEADLKTHCHQLGLDDYVHFMGFRNDLPSLYSSFDVLLFTSKMEGLGTSILDAWANQVPVVATNAGGIPEMIINNETGILAQVGDAKALSEGVIHILDHEDYRKRLVASAQAKLAEFSVDEMVRKTLNVYQNILNN